MQYKSRYDFRLRANGRAPINEQNMNKRKITALHITLRPFPPTTKKRPARIHSNTGRTISRDQPALRLLLLRLPAAAQSLIQLYQSKILGQNSLIDLHLSIKETTFGIQKVDISYIARDVLQLRQLDILARRLAQITFQLGRAARAAICHDGIVHLAECRQHLLLVTQTRRVVCRHSRTILRALGPEREYRPCQLSRQI